MSESKYCPRCGSPVPAESRFCPVCGQLLERRVEPPKVQMPPQPPSASAEAPSAEVQQAPKPLQWPERCPNCSARVTTGERYCPQCGFNLEAFARRAALKVPAKISYYGTKRRFFSFEGYELEGVVPAASMYIIWGFWNVVMALFVYLGWTELFLPEPFSTQPLVLLFAMAALMISAAVGLLLVNTPLYVMGMMGVATMLPVSFLQLMQALQLPEGSASPTGTHQLENVMSGIVGIIIAIASLLQSIRIRRYFFGRE